MTARKPCRVEKSTINGRFDAQTIKSKRAIAFTMMAVNLFFWYFATTQINDWVYYEYYMSVTSTVFNTLLYTTSSLVFTYLIYEIIKVEKFNLRRSIAVLMFMVSLSVLTLFIFPLPLI